MAMYHVHFDDTTLVRTLFHQHSLLEKQIDEREQANKK
jgi:hypothetical protein